MRLVCAVAILCTGAFTFGLSEIGLSLGGYGSSAYYIGALLVVAGLVLTVCEYVIAVRYARASRRETCCRKCGFVLRGLSEPRCPECGETI